MKRIISKDGTVKAVETSHGTVECDYFVNSAGRILVNITFKQGLFNSVSNFFIRTELVIFVLLCTKPMHQ